jgi:hypothetical protein
MLVNKSKRTRHIPVILVFLFFATGFSSAVEYQARISPAEHLMAGQSSGVQIVSGLWNQDALALADEEYHPEENTELLLNFNAAPLMELMDSRSPYAVNRSGIQIQNYERYRGSGSAMVLPGQGLELAAGLGSMFAPGNVWSDFSFEFWMYPAMFRDGEELFLWEGTAWVEDSPVSQRISISAERGRLSWIFDDFFISLTPRTEGPPQFQTSSVVLSSRTEIVPRTWSHHLLRYDSESGVLEYLINGRSEDVRYISSDRGAVSGGEKGTPLLPYVGEQSPNRVHIAPGFHGFLDDFRISREWVEKPELAVAEDTPGFAVVGPVDLGDDGIRLTGFDAEYRTPGNTDIRFSVLQRDAYAPLQDWEISDDSRWSFVSPGERAQALTPGGGGRFVYVRIEFFPDGTDRNVPMLQEITLTYDRDPPPPAPGLIRVESGDSLIYLSWSDVVASSVEGYLLYYGDSPGQYFGEDADLGPSPIDLGNVREVELTGLTNGKMYYFRLASYNSYNSPDRGLYRDRNISREVFARPSRIQE